MASTMAILYALSDNDGQCRLPDLIKLSGVNKQTVNSALTQRLSLLLMLLLFRKERSNLAVRQK